MHNICAARVLPGCALLATYSNGSYSRQRANLDMLIRVYNAAGATLASFNPQSSQAGNGLGLAAGNLSLPSAAHYFLSVIGSGYLDPLATGWSDYAALGQYTLSVRHTTFNGVVPPVPRCAPNPPRLAAISECQPPAPAAYS
jgi:hypothetical protein